MGPAKKRDTRMPRWMAPLREYRIVYKEMSGYGRLCPGIQEIWIKPTLPYIEKIRTLIHELLHLYYRDTESLPPKEEAELERERKIEAETEIILSSLNEREFGILEFFLSQHD